MISRIAFAVLALCVAGAYATEYNCDAESGVCQHSSICHDQPYDMLSSGSSGVLVSPGSQGNGWLTPTCICSAPYAGQACEYKIRECKDSPCQNGGTCNAATCQLTDGAFAYDCFTCTCPPQWTGSPVYDPSTNPGGVCDWPANGCAVNPNMCGTFPYSGSCADKSGANHRDYTCTCNTTAGWTYSGLRNTGPSTGISNFDPNPQSKNCTFNCLANTLNPGNAVTPCMNGGTCNFQSSFGSYCTCPPGYYGAQCEMALPCIATPCQNGGTCDYTFTKSIALPCQCAAGFYGPTCSQNAYCTSNPCMNGGTCVQNPSFEGYTGSCECGAYSGALCQGPRFCDNNPCVNGGVCVNGPASTSSPYLPTGQCVNCTAGFFGPHCQYELTGCGEQGIGCAHGHVTPITAGGHSYDCPCSDSVSCAAVGAAAPTSIASTQGVTASGTVGADWHVSRCQCSGLHYDCRCNSTYVSRCPGTVNGASNSRLGSGTNVDPVCQNGGACFEWADGWGCACRPGFWGSSCQNYDNPCLNNPCQNNGACAIETLRQVLGGGYWSNDVYSGLTFETVSAALDDRYWSYACTCKWPYYGRNCENVAPASNVVCTNNQCQNGATCGPNSMTYYSESSGNTPVKFSGNQLIYTNPYICNCPANYTGVYCQTPVVTCASNPDYCLNGGQCIDGKGMADGSRPACYCPCGFAGDQCEVQAANINPDVLLTDDPQGGVGYRLDFCSKVNCLNGGTCVHLTNGQTFACQCKSGWGDRYCQTQYWSGAASVVPSLAVAVAAAVAAALALRQ